jgi:hypothetical protein
MPAGIIRYPATGLRPHTGPVADVLPILPGIPENDDEVTIDIRDQYRIGYKNI